MDLNRIFMKNCCPTKVGGQAILEGLLMRGSRAMATAVRLPDGDVHLTVEPLQAPSKVKKIPIVRGVYSFVSSLYMGTRVLMHSAEILEAFEVAAGKSAESSQEEAGKNSENQKGKFETWLEKKFGENAAFNLAMGFSVLLAIAFVVGVFILLPTFALELAEKAGLHSTILLNLIEGVIRIAMFVAYISLITLMPDIRRTFEYHGAEHKTIHCYENGLELTPENAQTFYTLHPRCGTSFMMFVMIISLLVFSFLGWPNLWVRVLSRIALIPVIAGLSYEVLQFTGRHNSAFVKAMSIPGIMLRKLTTKEPDLSQLEVAIIAMKAVLPSHENPDLPVEYWVGRVHKDGTMEKDEEETAEYIKSKE